MAVRSIDLAARNRELGGVVSAELARATSDLYARLHPGRPPEDVTIVRDVAYGPDARHRLDLFAPADGGGHPRPAVVFVHGGNFVAGDKRTSGTPFYDNVGIWAARAGLVGVTMSYRLAPAHRWPAGRDDVLAALAWLDRHGAAHGAAPGATVLIGASAGATHVASAAARSADDPGCSRPRGVALLSGMYDLLDFGRDDVLVPYFGPDPHDWAAAAPLDGLARSAIPVLLAIAEHDPVAHHRQAARLADALRAAGGRLPWIHYLAGHNHFSEVLHIGTDERTFSDELARFVRRCTSNPEGEEAPT